MTQERLVTGAARAVRSLSYPRSAAATAAGGAASPPAAASACASLMPSCACGRQVSSCTSARWRQL